MALAVARGVELIASRFLQGPDASIDLATGRPVMVRRLPPCEPPDERRWTDACARLSRLWHEDLPPLLDHGLTSDGRFEAYGVLTTARSRSPRGNAVYAFLQHERVPDRQGEGGAVRLGMRLAAPAALVPLIDILDDGRSGRPVDVVCTGEPGAGATTFLRMAAAEGRRRGYVPISVRALERCPEAWSVVRDRSWLLLSDVTDSARAAHRWLLRVSTVSARSHILVRVDRRACRWADVVLRLEPLDADVLAAGVHVYPARLDEEDIRLAAVRSGGLPGRFLTCLRGHERRAHAALRVAEARPAYGPDQRPQEAAVEHPWSDLIAGAVRLSSQGRRAAAERDLRQIAAAARRRHMSGPAAAADVELARLLTARGRTSEARDLLTAWAGAGGDGGALSVSAALALAGVHLEDGALEAAESIFRVCRSSDPSSAALGLARTLCWQARYEEAEHALAPARESGDPRVRAASLAALAMVALGRQDLPDAARAGTQALSDAEAHGDAATAVAAAELLVAVHGRVGDRESVDRYAQRALAAARSLRSASAMFAVRAAIMEAGERCGREMDRRRLDRLLRAAGHGPALLRARLWAVAARAHPHERSRVEFDERVRTFVRATGARALLPGSGEPAAAALARDVTALLTIHETAPTPGDALRRLVAWLRDRLDARAVLVCDAEGAALARCGPLDPIAAATRVLLTRVSQPPWNAPAGLEAAVVVRYADAVRGALACRWPLSRRVTWEAVPLMTAAASVVGPALAALAERAAVGATAASDGMIGRSAAIQRLRDVVSRAAPSPFSVVIHGETGAGKELVARAIHQASPRRLRACVAINCAAVTDDLFETELFGHARGAFTGAHAERAGLFEQADGGTLFLDEVSELSPRAQAKLLRALQDGEVRRLGENHARRVDVRVIAASNRGLDEEVDAGRFRRDLLFRLAVVRIAVPPLRERRADIPLLAAHYWQSAAARAGSRAALTAAAVARLAQHDWPGNVRELQNVVAALAVQVPRGRVSAEQVSLLIGGPGAADRMLEHSASLEDARRAFEREFVSAALARRGGSHSAAARDLGISRQGLSKLLRRLEIADP